MIDIIASINSQREKLIEAQIVIGSKYNTLETYNKKKQSIRPKRRASVCVPPKKRQKTEENYPPNFKKPTKSDRRRSLKSIENNKSEFAFSFAESASRMPLTADRPSIREKFLAKAVEKKQVYSSSVELVFKLNFRPAENVNIVSVLMTAEAVITA